MGAPASTNRTDPSTVANARKLEDGYSTKVAFSRDSNIVLWEKTVTPPGIDGGDEIDTSTMFNTTWRTRVARSLKTLTPCSFTAAYDPSVYDEILGLINQDNGAVTVHFPDGSKLDFWGYLKNFQPNEHTEGEMPTATVTIEATMLDASFAEQAPVLASVSGT